MCLQMKQTPLFSPAIKYITIFTVKAEAQYNAPQEPSCQSTLHLMEVICSVVSGTNMHSEISLDVSLVMCQLKDV